MLEYDLRHHRSLKEDLANLKNGLGVVLFRTPNVLRVLSWGVGPQPPGLFVVDFRRVDGGLSDEDIAIHGIRYSTNSGIRVRGIYPYQNDLILMRDMGCVYEKFLSKPRNKDRLEVRRMVHNRIRKYLS